MDREANTAMARQSREQGHRDNGPRPVQAQMGLLPGMQEAGEGEGPHHLGLKG